MGLTGMARQGHDGLLSTHVERGNDEDLVDESGVTGWGCRAPRYAA
jgi:hypothetical protein